MVPGVQVRLLKNGKNGWYWEVVYDREVLERGVALSLEAARAEADKARQDASYKIRHAMEPPAH
jgi:hypothetical protein